MAWFGEGGFLLEPCAGLIFLSSPQQNHVCSLLPGAGITRNILLGKSKHFSLEKCAQVTGGFSGEFGDRSVFHVLSLDRRKGTLTCASLIPKYFRKPGRCKEYL